MTPEFHHNWREHNCAGHCQPGFRFPDSERFVGMKPLLPSPRFPLALGTQGSTDLSWEIATMLDDAGTTKHKTDVTFPTPLAIKTPHELICSVAKKILELVFVGKGFTDEARIENVVTRRDTASGPRPGVINLNPQTQQSIRKECICIVFIFPHADFSFQPQRRYELPRMDTDRSSRAVDKFC